MTMGQICFSHEYCTDCPMRIECSVRPLFYSEEKYQVYRKETLEKTAFLARIMGIPEYTISPSLNIGIKMMDKRRAQELKVHPTYSHF